MTGNVNAKTKNSNSITFTTSTLRGPNSVPRASSQIPDIRSNDAGIRRMNRKRNVKNDLLGDA
jgi:hypothetical protein